MPLQERHASVRAERLFRPVPAAPVPAAEDAAGSACRALEAELAAYPKPGLVSFVDNGSHADMNAGHFQASIAALRPFFAETFVAGLEDGEFAALRAVGLRAEASMLRATGGVNAHRGAIFCLGLLSAAAGRLYRDGRAPSLDALAGTVAERWGPDILNGLDHGPPSHGRAAWTALGMGGARTEAAAGFPCVLQAGAPAMLEALDAGASANAARVHALFAILAVAGDTALAHRGGREGVDFARRQAERFLAQGGALTPGWRDRALAVHRAFIARNLSPGGAADLLSATLFCLALSREAS